MPVFIHPIHPDNVRFLSSHTVNLLKSAHDPFYGPFDALDNAKIGEGTIYEIRDGEFILGVFYIRFRHNHLGRIMDFQYLAGELKKFEKELADFLWDLSEKERADELVYIGRRGFARVFPWLQEVGTVYRCKRRAKHTI